MLEPKRQSVRTEFNNPKLDVAQCNADDAASCKTEKTKAPWCSHRAMILRESFALGFIMRSLLYSEMQKVFAQP